LIGLLILSGLFFLVVLLFFFPFSFKCDFKAIEKGSGIELRFFRKKIYSTFKDQKNKGNSKDNLDPNDDTKDFEKSFSSEHRDSLDPDEFFNESLASDFSKSSDDTPVSSKMNSKLSGDAGSLDESFNDEHSDSSIFEELPSDLFEAETTENKENFSEADFLTLVFQPHLHQKIWTYLKRIFKKTRSSIRIRVTKLKIEGIQMEYSEMGFATSIFLFLKSQSKKLQNVELEMDWLSQKQFSVNGSLSIQFRLISFFILALYSAYFSLMTYIWYRRNKKKYLQNPSAFRLVFWRRKIIDILASESP